MKEGLLRSLNKGPQKATQGDVLTLPNLGSLKFYNIEFFLLFCGRKELLIQSQKAQVQIPALPPPRYVSGPQSLL